MKKLLAIALALVLVLGMYSVVAEDEEPLEMTMWYRGAISTIMPGGNTYFEDMCLEKYNVKLTVECIDKGALNEKISTALASQDYPDIMAGLFDTNQIREGAAAGVFLPLTEAIEANPHWSTLDKSLFASTTFDGEIYATLNLLDWPNGIEIRQDWLDNLGLAMPTDPESLAEVMHAFTYDDPDQNGIKDTYGLVMDSGLGCTSAIQYMFLPNNWFSFYIDEATNTIKNTAYLEDDTKDLLQWFADVYADGSFDPEWVVTSDADAQAKFTTGVGGIYSRGLLYLMNYGNKIAAIGGQIAAMPAYSRYDTNLKRSNSFNSGYVLTKACKNPEIGAQVLLDLYDVDGIMAFNYGRPGETYDFDAMGNFYWLTDEAAVMWNPGMILGCAFDCPLYTDEPELAYIAENMKPDFVYFDGVTLDKVTSQSDVYKATWADAGSMATEFRTKVILGEKTLDDWDEFFNEYKAIVDPILDSLNEIYQGM